MLARDSRTSRIALVLSLVLLQLPGASRSFPERQPPRSFAPSLSEGRAVAPHRAARVRLNPSQPRPPLSCRSLASDPRSKVATCLLYVTESP